jgi:hypothetical protein
VESEGTDPEGSDAFERSIDEARSLIGGGLPDNADRVSFDIEELQ